MQHKVRARRSGHWWAIDSSEHPGLHSQARRLDQVRDMAADALSLWLEETVVADDIEVSVEAGDLDQVMSTAITARRDAECARLTASKAMRDAASKAVEEGLTVRDVGYLLGVTHQMAAKLVHKAKTTAEVSS